MAGWPLSAPCSISLLHTFVFVPTQVIPSDTYWPGGQSCILKKCSYLFLLPVKTEPLCRYWTDTYVSRTLKKNYKHLIGPGRILRDLFLLLKACDIHGVIKCKSSPKMTKRLTIFMIVKILDCDYLAWLSCHLENLLKKNQTSLFCLISPDLWNSQVLAY